MTEKINITGGFADRMLNTKTALEMILESTSLLLIAKDRGKTMCDLEMIPEA